MLIDGFNLLHNLNHLNSQNRDYSLMCLYESIEHCAPSYFSFWLHSLIRIHLYCLNEWKQFFHINTWSEPIISKKLYDAKTIPNIHYKPSDMRFIGDTSGNWYLWYWIQQVCHIWPRGVQLILSSSHVILSPLPLSYGRTWIAGRRCMWSKKGGMKKKIKPVSLM